MSLDSEPLEGIEHGSESRYRQGCRCDRCYATYRSRKRASYLLEMSRDPGDKRHGTNAGSNGPNALSLYKIETVRVSSLQAQEATMYYLIYVTKDVARLGIKADSEFQLPVEGKGTMTLPEYVEGELGLTRDEWEVI